MLNFTGLLMFTGLIEEVCRVASVRRGAGTLELTVDLGGLAQDTKVGDSIAINGVCLTVARLEGRSAVFDLSGETLAKSTLGKLRPSSPVNAERALRPTDRLGGHIVLGHIDGTATIKTMERQGEFADIKFTAVPELLDRMVVKGSVALDGISLTVASLGSSSFGVAIIPQTLERTTLGKARIGDAVNVETDIIAKMIKKQLEKILPVERELTVDKLHELGF
jgi:riboflavin synthase